MIGALLALGSLFNLCFGTADCRQTWENASAHTAWAIAIPLAADRICGRDCRLAASGAWILGNFVYEDLTHGRASPSERRTDLVSKIVPTLVVNLLFEW